MPNSSRGLISAAGVGLVARGVSIALRFISLPLTLTMLSPERYGIWMIVLSLVGWLGMSDLGIPSALQNRLIQLWASGEAIRARAVFLYGFRLLALIGALVFILMGLAVFILPVGNWFKIELSLQQEFRFALLMCLISFAFALPGKLGSAIYNAHGRFIFPPLFDMAGGLVSFSCLLLAVVLKWNSLLALSFCMLCGQLGGGVVATLMAARKYDYSLVRAQLARREDSRFLLSKGGFFFLTVIGELLILQSDAMLIGMVLGASQVPYYLIPATLFMNFIQLQNVWLRPLWPVLTMLHASGDYVELKRQLKRTLTVSVLVAMLFGVGVIFFGDAFIRLWSHGSVGLTMTMACGLAAYTAVAAADNVLATFLNAFGRVEMRFGYTLFMGLVKVCAGWCILSKLDTGLQWLPFSYAIVMLFCSVPFALFSLKSFFMKKGAAFGI